MESKHGYQILDNSNNHSKQHSEISSFYSTFDNFMKNKMKKGLSSKIRQNEPYSFSKLMNSLYEFSKKKPDFELKMSTEKASIKKQKLFQGIPLKNFNDSSSQKKHNILVRKLISTPSNGSNITSYSNKKFNSNNNNEYKEDLNEMKHYEKLEKIILKLKDNIKNPDEFCLKCNEWIDEFEETKWGVSNVIKVNRRLYEINEKEKSKNLLISSIILLFLRINQLICDNNNPSIESNSKELSDIMIIHHKIYLLLCYNLLLENKINDDNNLFLVKQIKANLPKKIYMDDNSNKNIYLEEEIKSCNKIFFKMLKSLLSIVESNKNKNNLLFNEISLNNLFFLNISKLINLFKKIYQSKNNNIKHNKNNNLKINTLNSEGTKSGSLVFSLRNKNSMKKHYLKDEKEVNIFPDNNNTCNNFYLRKTHNSDIINFQNQSLNNKEYNFRKSYYYPLRKYKTKINDETEKIIEITSNQKENLANSYSCKNIGSKVESNKRIKINKNDLLKNMNINKCLKDINKVNTMNSKTKLNLNNNNINIIKKPKPPFLTSDILYSKFNKKNFTLILDLDETLIKFVTNINYPKGKIIFRPGLIQFLNKIFPLFDLILWTIAKKDYADEMINNIEKDKKYFTARLYRDHASYKNNIYVKDLSNLGRPLDKIIIIDDKESNFSLQRSNGILIRPFHGTKKECQNDYVLMDLYNILTKIIFDRSQDVRIGIDKYKKEIYEKISKINNNDLI